MTQSLHIDISARLPLPLCSLNF